jgi:hypothetical protein
MVRPVVWWPPAEPSPAEQAVIKAVRRARLFVLLRVHRHELFDERFQAELAEAYVDSPKGQPPVPPARLALATILQAYTGVSDDEVIEATVMDRRWQQVSRLSRTRHGMSPHHRRLASSGSGGACRRASTRSRNTARVAANCAAATIRATCQPDVSPATAVRPRRVCPQAGPGQMRQGSQNGGQ